MSNWDVHLVFIDGKSKKFWRARKDDSDLYVNWGRIGTDGQTQLKEFDSPEACQREYDKLVGSKRKKGYVDDGGAEAAGDDDAPTEVPKKAKAGKNEVVDLALDHGSRKIDLRLSADGSTLRTVVVEKYASPKAAEEALARIKAAMEAEGYQPVSRDAL